MGILERIKEIEEEIARTQKNKATEHHIGMLKARLAKLRSQLLETSTNAKSGSGSGKGEGFEIAKSGDARVCILGFPSVGKSTFLTKVTETESVSSEIDFTTLTCIAGVLKYKGAR
jgi:ribosome-interacting GTPase 1